MEQTLVSLPTASRRVGVSPTWLRAEAKAGRVPCLPVGKTRFLFNLDALTQALNDRAASYPVREVANA